MAHGDDGGSSARDYDLYLNSEEGFGIKVLSNEHGSKDMMENRQTMWSPNSLA